MESFFFHEDGVHGFVNANCESGFDRVQRHLLNKTENINELRDSCLLQALISQGSKCCIRP